MAASGGQVDRSPGVLRNKSTCTFVLTLGTNENTDAALVPVPYRSGAICFFLPAFMNKIRITTHSTPKRVPDANPTVPESEPSRQLEKVHGGWSKFHLIGGEYVVLVCHILARDTDIFTGKLNLVLLPTAGCLFSVVSSGFG
jgi:hypothetical protein